MMEMDFKMHNDLGLGFICKNARTSSKPTLRKVTFPVSAYETSKLSLTGFQCPTACRFPFFVLCMIIHNHLSSACPITQNECSNHISQFSIDIKVQDWLREGANKQVISSQADSLIKISRIWADFFPANTSNQPI